MGPCERLKPWSDTVRGPRLRGAAQRARGPPPFPLACPAPFGNEIQTKWQLCGRLHSGRASRCGMRHMRLHPRFPTKPLSNIEHCLLGGSGRTPVVQMFEHTVSCQISLGGRGDLAVPRRGAGPQARRRPWARPWPRAPWWLPWQAPWWWWRCSS